MSARKRNRSKTRRLKARGNVQSSVCEQRIMLSATIPDLEIASIDGSGNNLQNPEWGSTDEQLLRLTTVEYSDGISELAGEMRASAREVSNAVVAQQELTENDRYLTDLLWVWGQFIDHDIDLTDPGEHAEEADIAVPTGDPYFDPFGTGTQSIGFTRSNFDETTGDSIDNPRQQVNAITAFLDGSVVYGSDQERADALRTFSDGKLKTSEGDLLPFNEQGLANAGGTSDSLFLAGDVRANENIALTAMHTVWVREHNRIADEIGNENPNLTDEEIYQQARAIVRAELQVITYNEFLPALLGQEAIDPYSGYDETVDPSIANVFSTAAYRLGHSLLSPELLRLNADGTTADEGNIALQNAFFRPDELVQNGIDSILQGAASQVAQELDNQIVDDVRNFLFGPPGSGGFDLASLNIQRGRDHGLADYNQTREDFGLDRVSSFEEVSSDPDVVAALMSVYDSVDDIDVWVGALAEDHVAGASVGELMQTVLADQFTRLRDGDRFWYENVLEGRQLQMVEQTTLADVIERNTNVEIAQENAFYDAAVLYFAIDGNHKEANVIVRERGGQIEVVDQQNRRVLASQSAAQTEKVMIIGRDGLQDRIEIDGSISAADLPGGIVAWGGHGGKDQLLVNGTQHDDVISLASLGSSVNGKSLLNQNFEEIIVRGHAGNDHLTAAGQQLGARLVLDGGAGNDRLEGSDGNDELFGGTGRDELIAGLGRDLLVGGPGNDVLTGDRNDRLVQDELRDRMEMAMRRTARPHDRSIPDAPPQSDNRQQNERERDRDAERNTGPQRAEQRQDDLQAFMRRR